MVKVSIMDLFNAQPLAYARDPCSQIAACVLTSWFAVTRRVDWQLAHDEDWSLLGRADSFLAGAAARTRRISSPEEGAGRHERERRADKNFSTSDAWQSC